MASNLLHPRMDEIENSATPPFGPNSLDAIRKAHIEHVMRACRGNLKRASNLLQLNLSQLQNEMGRLGIVDPDDEQK